MLALAAALLLAGAPDDPTHLIAVQERVPFAFLLNTPTGGTARTSSSELIRFVTDTLRRDTSFAVQLVDGEVVKTCQGELTCLVLASRRDYERSALLRPDGSPLPYREHVRRLAEREEDYARYLLILSNVTVPDRPDRVSASLIDTDLALAVYHEADHSRPEWKERVETRISTAAMPKGTLRAEVDGNADAAQFVERLVRQDFAPLFEASGHWQPYGSVDLVTNAEGLEILLDGRSVGSTQGARTRLTKLLPGTRAISVRHPDYTTLDTTVTVRRGENTTVQVDPIPIVSEADATIRPVVFYSGIAVAAAGAGLLVFAAARQDRSVRTVCFDGDCPSGQFQTLGYDPNVPIADAESVNPNGVLVAPLGAALLTGGAAFTLGTGLVERASPWWSVLVGVVAGGVVYGLGTLFH
ncbi:MAG: PEGA domain-containing protein [Deltaproteobacteria bacterium]